MVECKQRTSIFANLKLFIHIIDQGKHRDQDSLNASSLLLEPEPATTGLRYAGQMRLSTRPATASGPVSLPRMLSLIHTTMGAVGSELTLDLKTDFFTNCDRQPVFIRGRFHDIWLDIHFMKLGAVNIGLASNSYILPEVPFGRPAARPWTMSYSGSDRISLRRKQWPITNDLAYTVEGSAVIDYELWVPALAQSSRGSAKTLATETPVSESATPSHNIGPNSGERNQSGYRQTADESGEIANASSDVPAGAASDRTMLGSLFLATAAGAMAGWYLRDLIHTGPRWGMRRWR
jgi:hypothetical protein